jgi:hypothetical protein
MTASETGIRERNGHCGNSERDFEFAECESRVVEDWEHSDKWAGYEEREREKEREREREIEVCVRAQACV